MLSLFRDHDNTMEVVTSNEYYSPIYNHSDIMTNRSKIAIYLPHLFAIRDFLYTSVWDEMVKNSNTKFYLLCRNDHVKDEIAKRNPPNIFYREFPPSQKYVNVEDTKLLHPPWQQKIITTLFRWLDEHYVFDSLSYRFAAINDLSHWQIRRRRSKTGKKQTQKLYYYRRGEKVGFPFSKSKFLYRLLYNLHHGKLNYNFLKDLLFLEDLNPDLFVFGRLHLKGTAYWSRALKRIGCPMVGVVSSWDHPTVHGPTPRGMNGYIVASQRMKEEMTALHGIDEKKVFQIGKVQMDIFNNDSAIMDRADFLSELGVPRENKIITFATNTDGLKEHERSIAQNLKDGFKQGKYKNVSLILRTHPQDTKWQQDFLPLADSKNIICLNSCSFGFQNNVELSDGKKDQILLTNLMKHSSMVIQSRSSIALDAIAFDTPVISLAFNGDLRKENYDSFVWEYAFEHYKPLVNANGMYLVGSYDALDQAISVYLSHSNLHAEGRQLIREQHIEPFDGQASERMISCIADLANKDSERLVLEGDWHYSGLGDTSWASKQICDLSNCVCV